MKIIAAIGQAKDQTQQWIDAIARKGAEIIYLKVTMNEESTEKKREAQRILNELEPGWLIFTDDEEANRAAIAKIRDPRILIRCNMEDDFQTWEGTAGLPLLCRLQELANILE